MAPSLIARMKLSDRIKLHMKETNCIATLRDIAEHFDKDPKYIGKVMRTLNRTDKAIVIVKWSMYHSAPQPYYQWRKSPHQRDLAMPKGLRYSPDTGRSIAARRKVEDKLRREQLRKEHEAFEKRQKNPVRLGMWGL